MFTSTSILGVIIGAGLKAAVLYFNNRDAQAKADANAKNLGAETATNKVNKDTADAESRADNAAVNARDTSGVIDDAEHGKF